MLPLPTKCTPTFTTGAKVVREELTVEGVCSLLDEGNMLARYALLEEKMRQHCKKQAHKYSYPEGIRLQLPCNKTCSSCNFLLQRLQHCKLHIQNGIEEVVTS